MPGNETASAPMVADFSRLAMRPCMGSHDGPCSRWFYKWIRTTWDGWHVRPGRIRAEDSGDGRLKLTADNTARRELARLRDYCVPPVAMEPRIFHAAGLHAVPPEELCALTAAPICADEHGRLWWHSRYCLDSLCDELIARGRCFLDYGGTLDPDDTPPHGMAENGWY